MKRKDVHDMSTRPKTILGQIVGVPMSPDAHLINTWWFRSAIALPIIIAVIVGWFFTGDANLQFERSPEGMNLFLQMFKLPIGIASLAIPIVAVIAANHRSMQTAQQIKEQNAQNIFSNHLEHRSYFFKFISDFDPFKGEELTTPRLYERLFPNALNGNLEPDEDFLFSILIPCHEILEATEKTAIALIESDTILKVLPNNLYNAANRLIKATSDPIHNYRAETDLDETFQPFSAMEVFFHTAITLSEGLIKSSNFYRFYFDPQNNPYTRNLKLVHEINTINLTTLKPKHTLYSDLKAAISNYRSGGMNEPSKNQESKDILKRKIVSSISNSQISTNSKTFKKLLSYNFDEEEKNLIKEVISTTPGLNGQ